MEILALLFGLVILFIPSMFAYARGHLNVCAIFALNMMILAAIVFMFYYRDSTSTDFGMALINIIELKIMMFLEVIGWVICFVWAFSCNTKKNKHPNSA